MKKVIITAISLTLMIMQNSPAYDMVVGTNHFDVIFETPALPSSLKDFIVEDVQRCYQAWGTNVEIRSSRAATHVMRIYPQVFMGSYYMDDLSAHDLNVPEDIVTNATGQLSLNIPSALIQKYSDALALKTNNLDKVEAADAFVDFLSSPEFANVTSNQVSNYILYKDLPPEGYLLSGEDIVKDLKSQEFYRPSILGFYYSPDGPALTNLCALLPTITKERTPSSHYHSMPAIWHDGKWKISMWNWE